jgi:hypothetical protein
LSASASATVSLSSSLEIDKYPWGLRAYTAKRNEGGSRA